MHDRSPAFHRRLLALLTALLLVATAAPAIAHDDVEAEDGPLEVELRPAVAPLGAPVHLEVELDDDDESDDEPGDDDAEEDTDETADAASDSDARTGVNAWDVTVDFGDDSAPVTLVLYPEDDDLDEGQLSHVYESEGAYTVTVTAARTGSPTAQVALTAQVGVGSARLSRDNRYGTGVRISQESFPEDGSADAVLLARGDHFADALAASSLTMVEHASVLLTGRTSIPVEVAEEIQRVLADDGVVYVFGGEGAVSADVVTAVEALGFPVERVAGVDRIDTSVQIARFLVAQGVEIDEVIIAGAANFPDALAVAPHAARESAPVLLTGRDSLDPRVLAFLGELGDPADVDVMVVGGTGIVSADVVAELQAAGHEVERVAGRNRYETAVAIARATNPQATSVVVATGRNFADALSGASYAGRSGTVLLLVGEELPAGARGFLQARSTDIRTVHVLGGAGAVPDTVRTHVEELTGR